MDNIKKGDEIWIPNKKTGEKLILIQMESSINEIQENLDNKTLYEYTLEHEDTTGVIKIAPKLRGTVILKQYERMLPLDNLEYMYSSVYSKIGGVLNLFNFDVKENIDKDLKALFKRYDDKNRAINIWKDTKSELWSGLTPRLVWAGGGKVEKMLLMDFCNTLTKKMGNKHFYTEGLALISAIECLRIWQLMPNKLCQGKTPAQAIIEEREEIYSNKVALLKEKGVQCDFY